MNDVIDFDDFMSKIDINTIDKIEDGEEMTYEDFYQMWLDDKDNFYEMMNDWIKEYEDVIEIKTNDYQKGTQKTAIYPNGNWREYLMNGLVSEVGEIAGKVKKSIRDGKEFMKEDWQKEMGDVLWYISQLHNELGLSLQETMKKNLEKLQDRQERGVLKGSGDDR